MQIRSQVEPYLIVIDDEPAVRNFAASIAALVGFTTDTAATSVAFVDLLEKRVPSVIILNLNMPGTDGIQMMSDLATRGINAKIVVMSSTDMKILEAARELASHQGLSVEAIFQKPIQKLALSEVLTRLYAECEPFSPAMLKACLAEGLLDVFYQPKVSLATYDVIGSEALLRCKDRAGRPVPVDLVIETAETSGLIDDITLWVFQQAVAQRASWSRHGLDLSVAVNLSARTSLGPDIPGLFISMCERHEVSPQSIIIEITETAAMDARMISTETLLRLRLNGFRLSVDDFGTGHSSLLRLKQLPMTEIKVDKSFVTNICSSRDDAAITKAIIGLAQNLELHCVIEGAESRDALNYAEALGCNDAQGFFISRPIPSSEMPSFIKSWQRKKMDSKSKVFANEAMPRASLSVTSPLLPANDSDISISTAVSEAPQV
jgi:EAL domain-containing protein (putative c-di-GMP-specific phosphodiesterase class I)